MSHHHVGLVQMQTPQSIQIVCPSCGQMICTEVRYAPTIKTHIMGMLLCILCCWPCVCVPYCMKSCQNANHYCPNCNAYIGTYSN